MSVVETAKTVYDLAKKGMTLEAQEMMMQLREEALGLQEENLRLKAENLKLKAQIGLQETVHFRRRVYWRDGDELPYCPYCYEKSHLLIHLASPIKQPEGLHHDCPECERTYLTTDGVGDFTWWR
jgi:hypothetical protein